MNFANSLKCSYRHLRVMMARMLMITRIKVAFFHLLIINGIKIIRISIILSINLFLV